MSDFKAIPSNYMFNALKDADCIIMACNTRTPVGLLKGIFRAAKDLDAAVMMELAKSESDLNGGYTGMTPQKYSELTSSVAQEVGFDIWALHADHTTIKKGSEEEVAETKKLISAQVKAGYTSFAMDCSFLFNKEGANIEEQLSKNIEYTIDLVNHLKKEIGNREFGLEVEVGEIGKKDEHGRVLTSPEEAVTFISKLNDAGIVADGLAIANGSAHGNAYDAEGNLIPQLSIDIPQTIKVAEALKKAGFDTRIVQHGITGTPLEFIATKFPKNAIVKGNVGTNWQNIVWDVLKVYEPELWAEIKKWVEEKYGEEAEQKGIKTEDMLLGKYSKKAFKPFYDQFASVDNSTVKAIEDNAYANALLFFKAFGAVGSAKKVREAIK
jgi:fructose-bisphosphate aldolase, class II